ncbi:MAG: hypothetical protein ACPG8W_08810 [Candidatus Promineifilaceae bacterium]
MSRKKAVLWIEDDATYNLQYVASPVIMNPHLDLTLAATVTEAVHQLTRKNYDAVVFDLRLPPGDFNEWISMKQYLNQVGEPPRLGLHLLLNLFQCAPDEKLRVSIPQMTSQVDINRVGILSVDPLDDVGSMLQCTSFRADNYRQKRAGMSSRILLNLVERLVQS